MASTTSIGGNYPIYTPYTKAEYESKADLETSVEVYYQNNPPMAIRLSESIKKTIRDATSNESEAEDLINAAKWIQDLINRGSILLNDETISKLEVGGGDYWNNIRIQLGKIALTDTGREFFNAADERKGAGVHDSSKYLADKNSNVPTARTRMLLARANFTAKEFDVLKALGLV